MKLDKIYTRSGDDGSTSLGSGKRVSKADLRVEAYGTVDEANSVIGLSMVRMEDPGVRTVLMHIQNDLFDVGADLCKPESAPGSSLRITASQIEWIEKRIDFYNEPLEPLNSFVLPGGTDVSAHLHVARTVVRRAERCVVKLASEEAVNLSVLEYLNRLSDLLFVLARFLNDRGRGDVNWQPGAHR
jgi:cob(I)alamin adenosyltransferase